MGDAADAAWDDAYQQECDRADILRGLRDGCKRADCDPEFFVNEDALFKCKRCGRTTDL